MSDETGNGLFNPTEGEGEGGSSQPSEETPLQPVEEAEKEGQPQYVTEDALNKRLDEFERKVQSSRDSALSTFDKRIKQKIDTVEKDIKDWRDQGVKITPQQEEQRRLNAIREAMLEEPDADTSSNVPDEANKSMPGEDVIKEINARAYQISQQTGIALEEGDPELMLLDQSSPDAFIGSFRNALYQKKLRTGENGTQPETRIPSMGQQTKKPPGADEEFLKEYKAAAGKGLGNAREIREKWASKGVDTQKLIQENF